MFYLFILRWKKKTFLLVENIFRTNKIVSISPLKNKQTSFCHKSRHLFLWQTNRTTAINFKYGKRFRFPPLFNEWMLSALGIQIGISYIKLQEFVYTKGFLQGGIVSRLRNNSLFWHSFDGKTVPLAFSQEFLAFGLGRPPICNAITLLMIYSFFIFFTTLLPFPVQNYFIKLVFHKWQSTNF